MYIIINLQNLKNVLVYLFFIKKNDVAFISKEKGIGFNLPLNIFYFIFNTNEKTI